MNSVLVSVIMPTYNDAPFLEAAVKSVLSQSFKELELIIINDGSTDVTNELLAKLVATDSRIVVIDNGINKGLVETLNVGLSKAQGEFVARIDSNDVWIDGEKITKQVEYLRLDEKVGLVGTWAEAFNVVTKDTYVWKTPLTDSSIRAEILKRNCFLHTSVLFRKKLVEDLGGYDAQWSTVEDYELWLRLGKVSNFANLPLVGVRFHVNDHGITQTKNLEQIHKIFTLANNYEKVYPGYYFAIFKWHVQSLIGRTLGFSFWANLKKIIFK